MNEENKRFISKIKVKINEHKNEIIIVGVTVTAVVGTVLIMKNWESIKRFIFSSDLKSNIRKKKDIIRTKTAPISVGIKENVAVERVVDVSKHIRKLPDGCYASLKKIESALENGFMLEEHQTWVDTYTKICA